MLATRLDKKLMPLTWHQQKEWTQRRIIEAVRLDDVVRSENDRAMAIAKRNTRDWTDASFCACGREVGQGKARDHPERADDGVSEKRGFEF